MDTFNQLSKVDQILKKDFVSISCNKFIIALRVFNFNQRIELLFKISASSFQKFSLEISEIGFLRTVLESFKLQVYVNC